MQPRIDRVGKSAKGTIPYAEEDKAAEIHFDLGPQERESIDILVFRRIDNESQFRDLKYLERFWPQSKTEVRGLSEFFNRAALMAK